MIAAAAVAVLVLGGGAAWFLRGHVPTSGSPLVAVLPLRNPAANPALVKCSRKYRASPTL